MRLNIQGWLKKQIETLFSTKANKTLDNITTAAAGSLNAVGARTVVQTYWNGSNWYRIWSDGWIEQGGVSSFTGAHGSTYPIYLLTPFSGTGYTILRGGTFAISTTAMIGLTVVYRATNYFSIQYASQNAGSYAVEFNWYTCGY